MAKMAFSLEEALRGSTGFFTSGSALTEISLASLQKAKTTGPKTQDRERLQYGSELQGLSA
jgi:hypothetical protein